jgi:HupE/UreJ protein
MKTKLRRCVVAGALLLALAAGSFAHRLDEYLQATLISVEENRISVLMRLIPGVAVAPSVLASIDTNEDGVISEAEQRGYAQRVLGDLSITVDGAPARPTFVSQKFSAIEQMKEGLGEIQIEFTVDLRRSGPQHRIIFVNHHENGISAYLVNCLVPRDPRIRILSQNRNENQSFYQLDYAQVDSGSDAAPWQRRTGIRGWVGAVGFASIFRLGMRHIAEGTDHLLFLLALLLPAPLLAMGSRWVGFAGGRESLMRILKVVTAFTAGHSLTLALAALGVVHVPSRPIEVLIAMSILVSAAHAVRPLFPGREAAIAGFFGLIHGLAFASSLGQLGLDRWQRVASILGFNLGIETMQVFVVAVTMPSLVLLSRTRWYSVVRIGGAVFAGVASVGWIGERLFGMANAVNAVVNGVAHHGAWVAVGLFLMSVVCWRNAEGSLWVYRFVPSARGVFAAAHEARERNG